MDDQTMTNIKALILLALDESDGQIEGTEHLAEILHLNNHAWVRKQLSALEEDRLIRVIRSPGGRGHENIIRRNRNSPGYPRNRR